MRDRYLALVVYMTCPGGTRGCASSARAMSEYRERPELVVHGAFAYPEPSFTSPVCPNEEVPCSGGLRNTRVYMAQRRTAQEQPRNTMVLVESLQ